MSSPRPGALGDLGRHGRRLGAEPVRGELADPDSIAAGAAGCEVAFHLAAHLGQWGTREEFVADNVTGTENALAGCREAGVRRFVHCGTEAALLAGEPLRSSRRDRARCAPTRRRSTPRPRRSPSRRCAPPPAEGFEAVVLRPRLVWGAGRHDAAAGVRRRSRDRQARLDRRRRPPDRHHPRRQRRRGAAAGRGPRAAGRGLLRHRRRAGRLPRVRLRAARDPGRRAADPLAAGLARHRDRRRLGEADWRLLRLKGEPPLTRLALWLSSQECTIDISKARTELGYEPVIDRQRGLEELRNAATVGTVERGGR